MREGDVIGHEECGFACAEDAVRDAVEAVDAATVEELLEVGALEPGP